MHDKMMKMLMGKKKEGKTLSDADKKAKLQALGGMRDMASQMMGSKLKNLKKVTVASDSKPGLQKGLNQAQDLVDQSPQDDEAPDNDPNNMSEGGSVYDRGDKGGHVAQMPEEFDKDLDEANKEHDMDEHPRDFNAGGEADEEASESPEEEDQENESLEKMVEDAPSDPNELDELIKMLEEKKAKLS